MWKIGVTLSLVALFSLHSVSLAATTLDNSQPAVTLTYNEYNQLSNNLNQLEQNSKIQQQRINQLETLLQTASLSTNESTQALIEARQQLNEAKAQTAEQAQQLQKLNQLLETQTQQLNKAQTSLAIANESLTQLERDLRRERAATNRNRTIAIIAGAAALYFATR